MTNRKKNKLTEPQSLADLARTLPEAAVSYGRDEFPYSPEERRARLEELFAPPGAWGDLSGHRLSVALRIVTALAGAGGHASLGDSLAHVERGWSEYVPGQAQGIPSSAPPYFSAVVSAELPLLPHAIVEQGDHETVAKYARTARLVARALGIVRDREGRLGLDCLLDDMAELRPWPDRHAIVAIEHALTLRTYEAACVTPLNEDEPGAEPASFAKARALLLGSYKLSTSEADHFLALARRRAMETLPETLELARSEQIVQLADLARRCAQSLSLRDEIAARRLLAQVSGTTRGVVEDAMSEFIGVVRSVSQRRDELPAPTRVALPSAEPEALAPEPYDDGAEDDDGEALRAFDRENA